MSVSFEALTSPVVRFINALQDMENQNCVKGSHLFLFEVHDKEMQ